MSKAKTTVDVTGEREAFAAYVCDDQTKLIIEECAEAESLSPDLVFKGGIASSVRALGAMPCPHILFIDLSETTSPLEDMQALADVCEPDTIVVALGAINDVSFYRDLLTVGVQEYLVKPVSKDMISEAISQSLEMMNQVEEADVEVREVHSRHILCVGVRGGLGTSQLAANLAWMSASQKIDTSLLDLDPFFGIGAMTFDLEPGRGLPDALENPARVDGLFLERAVVKAHPNLAIMAAEAPIGMIPDPTSEAVEKLVNTLGENYGCVIVDVPRTFLATHTDLLTASTDIVLVTDLSLASARDCIRLLSQIKSFAPAADVHIVANRVGAVNEVTQRDFENSIESNLDVLLPEDRKAMIAATQKGKVLVETAPSSKFAQAVKTLFSLIHEEEADSEQNKGWLQKFLGK
ncbi:cellulose synthase operon protein YhjQ/BcsQ [Temperatibacter marinus]|uniref:Cellulose synthase operon protein YhjQ/BcsQ n=1 Tax=Temperatibacter marinus TaxID=1456591 RepID=A0AA52H9L6_9PROT|nr:cellulose synthase operon protein YhjQ/BcsQ [Temperatibacter marinus]WND02647.1 cellulose synthase operon protein YhjQ/BcsQ [Temperatibacter marinus]